MTVTPPSDDESEEFDLFPADPDLFQGPIPDFDIVGILGSGGMGRVYKARQPNLDRFVALKILSGSAEADDFYRFEDRFLREATAMAKLRHPNIVSLYHYGKTDEGQVYFAMEFVEGAELTDYLHSGVAKPEHILYWAIQACSALQFAHESGIIHRDIKPSNLLIDGNGDLKIADFGLAKFSREEGEVEFSQLTQTDVIVGTPNFIAPELLEDPSEVTPASDLYSLGVTLYTAITGKIPRGLPSPASQLVPGLDPRWDGILFKCLAGTVEKRFESAADLQDSLEELLDNSELVPSGSLRASNCDSAKSNRDKQGARRMAILGSLVVLCLLGLSSFFGIKKWQVSSVPKDSPAVMVGNEALLPKVVPLSLSVPTRPNVAGKVGLLEFNYDGSAKASLIESQSELVSIWGAGAGARVTGLRSDGKVWFWPEMLGTNSPELEELVWLSHNGSDIGALKADGSSFLIREDGTVHAASSAGSTAMIAPINSGQVILLGMDGRILRSSPGENTEPTEIPSINERYLAIGSYENLLSTMSYSGDLSVWRVSSESQSVPECLHEWKTNYDVHKSGADPSPYRYRWIPTLRWAVVSPEGAVLSIDGSSPAAQLDFPEPGMFHLGDFPGDENFRRVQSGWSFSLKWEPSKVASLNSFSEGAEQLVIAPDAAFAIFPQSTDIAERFEEKEAVKSESSSPEVGASLQVWGNERVEIRTAGEGWNEKSARLFSDQVEEEMAMLEPILISWGLASFPVKISISEAGVESSTEPEVTMYYLSKDEMEEIRLSLEDGKVSALVAEFLLPEAIFSPISRKLVPPNSSLGVFGKVESHLVEFCQLFARVSSGVNEAGSEDWEASKTAFSTLVASDGYHPERALQDPKTGGRFFSGLLATLYDQSSEGAFFDKLLVQELLALPDATTAEGGVEHFILAASAASEKNLESFFRDTLNWPVSSTALEILERQFPEKKPSTEISEFRPAPNDLLAAWEKAYQRDIFPATESIRIQLEDLRSRYRDALDRAIVQYQENGNEAAAEIFVTERDKVGDGYTGPLGFHPVIHRGLDPSAQQAIRDLDRTLGRTYRERLRTIVTEVSSVAGGRVTRSMDELFRHQHLFTLDGDDEAAQWAFDRRNREIEIYSLGNVYEPRLPLDLTLRYEELIRWAVGEGASMELVQPITPTQKQSYTVHSMADVQAGRFVWQRLKIVGVQRGAQLKPWSDIHIALLARTEDLETLECGCGTIGASTLAGLAALPKLKSLSLSGAKIEESDLAGISSIGEMELEKLSLVGAELPADLLSILAAGPISETLVELSLANTETVDILSLSNFRKLKRVDLTGCSVPQENIEQFKRRNRNCLVIK